MLLVIFSLIHCNIYGIPLTAKDAKDYRCILKALETVMEKVNQDDPYLHKLRQDISYCFLITYI